MVSKNQNSEGLQKAQRIGSPFPSQRLYDLKSAAQYLGRPVWGVRELIWAGKLPVIRDGRKLYLDIGDMNEYIEHNRVTMI